MSRGWMGWAAVAAATGLLLMPLPPAWTEGAITKVLDLAHVPLFAGLTLTFYAYRRARGVGGWVAAVALAGGFELLQLATGRTASWGDFANGVCGATWAVAVLACVSRPTPPWLQRWLLAAAATVACWAWPLYDAWPYLADLYDQRRRWPVLADFRTPYQWVRFRADSATTLDETGHATFWPHLVPDDNPWATLSLHSSQPDWTAYTTLTIDVTRTDLELSDAPRETEREPLLIHITDYRPEVGYLHRFNGEYPLPPGRSRLTIPLAAIAAGPAERPLDLRHVRRIFFTLPRSSTAVLLHFHRIALE